MSWILRLEGSSIGQLLDILEAGKPGILQHAALTAATSAVAVSGPIPGSAANGGAFIDTNGEG